ncbi:hypothetical protein P3X46_021880 [Hevea brasiliensis]|uniref:ADP-ribosyl cyclase/cyclic ADP-ribose hydrolase n=2 Tax=Hevea brasiliensis TaxID=3981 RepID=A0ABQ9LKY4_HEVBR|nr:hypothetical protein P3X46_021880 [Hevea brasiliensis]
MASSSSSLLSGSPCPSKCHVFLSFNSEDNHKNFVGHLCKRLSFEGVYTIRNDEKLELLEPIEESRFFLVLLSENYVASIQCLDELVKIIDCWERMGKMVVPIFYNVDPIDVRDQRGKVAEAFVKHEEVFREYMEKVQRWKDALTKVASICGWDSQQWEDKILIEQIARDISDKLIYTSSSNGSDFVGMGSHITEMERILHFESNAVHMVGIWGMGGIGKTTIAKVIYDKLCSKFEVHCFLANVKENFREHGATSLQQKILLEKRKINTWTFNANFSIIKRRLCHKKVLLVLDDVDDLKQLEALAREPDWFGQGSRIIITTRDKHLLFTHGVKDIYDVQYLNTDQALQLFSQHAFKQNNPKIEYLGLSKQFTSFAKGLPLALKVLGAFLNDKTMLKWQSVQNELAMIPDLKIHDVLRVSFDGLDDTQKDVFLDIACFFNEENKEFVRDILEGCGFFPDIAFAVLEDKALITISNNSLLMHDLLKEMGHEIVQEESKDPGKRSRLWIPDDIFQVLAKNMGTQMIEGIVLNMSKIREMHLSSETFAKMHSLRLLKFYSTSAKPISTVHLPDEGLRSLSSKLRLLHWECFPSKSLPSSFHAEKLVELRLVASNVEQLWTGVQDLVNLKRIDLSYSRYLTRIPDLSKAQNLERLELVTCQNLVEVSSSVQCLNKLVSLDLSDCKNLRSLSGGINLKSLKALILTSCSSLSEFPEISGDVECLSFSGTAIEELPQSIGSLPTLAHLYLKNCTRLKKLPSSIAKLTSLSAMFLSGCLNITKIPEIPQNVECLDLSNTAIEEVPSAICTLSRLSALNLSNCKRLKSFPNGICKLGCLRRLSLSGCSELEGFHNLKSLPCLQSLDLSSCDLSEFPSNLSDLSSLEDLDLSKNNFQSLPATFKILSKLKLLNLSHCKRLMYLLEIPPCIKVLKACHCTSLEIVPRIKSLWEPNIECWDFANCFTLNQTETNNIVEDAQGSILHMATASKQDDDNKRYRSQFRYPGGEIPEWFCKKDTGSSLTLMLSSNGRPLLGISFCVVISCEIPSAVRNVCCKCHLKAVKGESDDRFFTSHYWAGNEEILNSDNIFLWFNSWETESAKGDNGFNKYYQASFEFLASDHSNKLINMKKCGVHLLYSEETNESQVKTADKNFTAVSEDCWVLTREDTNNKRGRDDDCFTGSKPYESGRSNKRIRRCSA